MEFMTENEPCPRSSDMASNRLRPLTAAYILRSPRRCIAALQVIGFLIGCGASPLFAAKKSDTPSAAPAPAGQVAAMGALSAKVSRKGEQLHFWISVANQTPQSICSLTVTLPDVTGFGGARFETPSRNIEAAECPKPAVAGSQVHGLAPGQSAAIQGSLVTVDSHEPQSLEAVVSWTSPAGVPSQAVVSLGQNSIESGWDRFWRGAYEVLKDFALPILLLIITVAVGWWDKRRENARKEADEQKERGRKAADEVRTWQAETWKQMLPISHDMATKHYTRIGQSIRDSLEYIERCWEETDAAQREPAEREAFYNLLLLGRQVEEMGDQVGGLFFKDRVGEKLASECWSDYLERFYGFSTETARQHYQQSIEACGPNGEGKKEFIGMLSTGPVAAAPTGPAPITAPPAATGPNIPAPTVPPQTVVPPATPAGDVPGLERFVWDSWPYFRKRYREADGAKAVLRLGGFGAVLEYEMNRPYEHWYRRAEKLTLRRDDPKNINVEAVLIEIAAKIKAEEGQDSDFDVQAKRYIDKGKKGLGDGESPNP